MPRWRRPLPWLSTGLLLLNAAIAAPLFRTVYHADMGSVEGVFIAYARYAREHWPDLGWCRFWFTGIPFENAYPPGLHLTVAAVSALAHISTAWAFHIVAGILYALGPVTLFWMAFRLTRELWWSFAAGLLYSLISPSAFLVPDIARDLGGLFRAQRLHTMVVYGNTPHVCSLTLVPLAILALDLALERRRPVWIVAAAVALAAVPLINWPGAVVLAFAVVAYGLTATGSAWRRWALIGGIGLLGYALALPWMPPSTVLTTIRDTEGFLPVNRFAPRHLLYAVVLAAGTWAFLRFTRRMAPHLRFFLLFLFYMAAITLGSYWFDQTLLAQPRRFHLAMEMGFLLSLVFGARALLGKRPAIVRAAAVALALLCVVQFVQYRRYVHGLIRPIDITQTSEYKTAMWFDRHMRDSRVMVPGSTTFWLNAFTDTPQIMGCCSQGVLNETALYANYGITTDIGAGDRAFENSLLWFKALGVRAVAVSGPQSTEVYKPFYHPHKFEGRLPVLWRDGDDVIYAVPWRHYSIAHAMAPGELPARTPIHGVDSDPLIPYIAALDRPSAPNLDVRWLDNETIVISGNVDAGQIVSLQETADPGWHAAVNGTPRRVFADKLGFMAVEPDCHGPCTITIHYRGSMEIQAARWINRAAILGSVLWILAGFRRSTAQPSAPAAGGPVRERGAAATP